MPTSRRARLFVVGTLACLSVVASSTTAARAQGAAPAPLAQQNAIPEKVQPAPSPPLPSQPPDENLSRRLERSDGVLTPPPTGDTEIHVPPKDEGAATMPIIPPPGSPGGRQDIQPK